MDFALYEAADFASDEFYQRYFFRMDEADIAFWENWIRDHPEKMEAIIQADQLLTIMTLRLPEEEQALEFKRMEKAIARLDEGKEAENYINLTQKANRRLLLSSRWMAAALVAFLILSSGLAGWWLRSRKNDVVQAVDAGLLTKNNTSNKTTVLLLPDSSMVTLQPGASISYPEQFAADQRVVSMDGEVFFEVTKNPARPFFVLHDRLVTRVLGTSFTVKTEKANRQVEVAVLTGRVEVYERADDVITHKKSGSSVVILPNYKVLYQGRNGRFDRMLVDKPLPLVQGGYQKQQQSVKALFDFKGANLNEIVARLKKTYGIDISFDDPRIGDCHFTGNISGMGLFEQLDILCKSVNAFYEVDGVSISVRGKGCQ